MNKLVSFELEKLLLEKNIDMPVQTTISDVVMWLYEKHGIWISSSVVNGRFRYEITKTHGNYFEYSSFDYILPTEAYEKAIFYCLTNII